MKKMIFIVNIFLLVVLSGCINQDNNDDNNNNNNDNNTEETGKFDIHFIEFDNDSTGDAIFIQTDEVDMLIDSGSEKSASTTIMNYIKPLMNDNKLEYVVATHAHFDHIAGFVGTKNDPGILEEMEAEVIIEYNLSNSTSKTREDYEALRDEQVKNGATYYTGLSAYEKGSFDLGSGVKMKVLYQRFYEEKTSDENEYSVCLLLEQGDNKVLLTADLEKDGEASLIEKNNLPEVDIFKAGHHGSVTSTTDELLSIIKPKVVPITCVAGSDEYTDNKDTQFPTQEFINRVAKYTDKLYCPSYFNYEADEAQSLNGSMKFSFDENGEVIVECVNNNLILKETAWFKQDRVWPSYGV